jgi:hypothetical protein
MDDALADDDPDLLHFTMAVSWIACWMSLLSQKYWHDIGKPDGPVFTSPDASHAFFYLAMMMSKVALGRDRGLLVSSRSSFIGQLPARGR